MRRASPYAMALLQILSAMLLWLAGSGAAWARNHIAAELVVERPARAGEQVELALHFRPEPGWHGYWANPGDAGFGMRLEWSLPEGADIGELRYPVPQTLLIDGLMNHVYERDYAVLARLALPQDIAARAVLPLRVKADWLACSDTICVPETAVLHARLEIGSGPADTRFDGWLGAIPPLLASPGRLEAAQGRLRIAVPLPADRPVGAAHLFIENDDLVDYAGPQAFFRKGDWLIAELPLRANARLPRQGVRGIVKLAEGEGLGFVARKGHVPSGGEPVGANGAVGSMGWLALAALAGGLLLNLMPCVFPILSLKALSLARAGESAAQARREGVAYTAGTMAASLALGGVLLVLRAGGEQIGWAFQLQDPRIVTGLLLLAVAMTANFAGVFAITGPSFDKGAGPTGAFATGLLAAFVATPCTGPFMAAALGAALLLPPVPALALFAALGVGLGLPFLLLGWVPRLRRMLPRPGAWMERFRRWMAVPMGLTAVALGWLVWRLGGAGLLFLGCALAVLLLVMLALAGRRQRKAGRAHGLLAIGAVLIGGVAFLGWPERIEPPAAAQGGVIEAAPFSEAALASARASGRPVFVWFTADWCITCKVNERVAIEREAVRDAFARAGVIVLKGDWTQRDPDLTRFLTRQGAAGVPLYLWYRPGREPEHLSQLLAPDALLRLARQAPQAE